VRSFTPSKTYVIPLERTRTGVEQKVFFSWLVDFVEYMDLHGRLVENEAERSATVNPSAPPAPQSSDSGDGMDAWEMEEQVLLFHIAMEPSGFVAKWLEDVFVLDLAAKLRDRLFTGGADEVDDGVGDGEVENRDPPCPFCNRSIGDETEQHVLKCKYAHEEQEALECSGIKA